MIRLSCDCCSAILVHKLSEALGYYAIAFELLKTYQDFEPNGRFGQKEMMGKEANDAEMTKKIK